MREPRQPSNLVAMLLSVVSGFGHFYLDHYLLGALLFGGFVTTLNGVILGATLQSTAHAGPLRVASLAAFAAVWVFGLWHAYRLSYGTDRAALARARAELLREGLLDYLRDDLEDSARKLQRAVALDVDWADPDPLFHLGVVYNRLAERRALRGDHRGARRSRRRAQGAFRTCLARDPNRKWRAEVAVEQAFVRRSLSVTGRMRQDARPSSTRLRPISRRLGSISTVLTAPPGMASPVPAGAGRPEVETADVDPARARVLRGDDLEPLDDEAETSRVGARLIAPEDDLLEPAPAPPAAEEGLGDGPLGPDVPDPFEDEGPEPTPRPEGAGRRVPPTRQVRRLSSDRLHRVLEGRPDRAGAVDEPDDLECEGDGPGAAAEERC